MAKVKKKPVARPRYRFCWWCSRQLQANYHREIEVDGHKVIVHADCAKPAQESP